MLKLVDVDRRRGPGGGRRARALAADPRPVELRVLGVQVTSKSDTMPIRTWPTRLQMRS
jgi:hypothetical protein